jgi:hypothetical protein
MLEREENFKLAINQSGIEIHLPRQQAVISGERLSELDALYAERTPGGQPTGWGMLIEELREIRRAVEAGLLVQIEDGRTLRTWG